MSQTNPAEAESVAVNFKLPRASVLRSDTEFQRLWLLVPKIRVLSPLWNTCAVHLYYNLSAVWLCNVVYLLTNFKKNTQGKSSLDVFHALVCGLGQPSYCSQCEMSSLMKISSTGQSPAAPFVCSRFEIVYDYRDCITSSFCQFAALFAA